MSASEADGLAMCKFHCGLAEGQLTSCSVGGQYMYSLSILFIHGCTYHLEVGSILCEQQLLIQWRCFRNTYILREAC